MTGERKPLSEDVFERLLKYASCLEKRISFEERSLRMLGWDPEAAPAKASDYTEEEAGRIRALREPVSRTLVSYQSMLNNLYEIFPELRKYSPKNREAQE